MHSAQVIALNILFIRRKHWRAVYVCARREVEEAAARQRGHGGPVPSVADLDAVAELKMKSEHADEDYLDMLGVVASHIIRKAKHGASDGRVEASR